MKINTAGIYLLLGLLSLAVLVSPWFIIALFAMAALMAVVEND